MKCVNIIQVFDVVVNDRQVRLLAYLVGDDDYCYDLKSLEWDRRTTLVLSNTRELDRVQSILPYILILMVRANYCAPYPK